MYTHYLRIFQGSALFSCLASCHISLGILFCECSGSSGWRTVSAVQDCALPRYGDRPGRVSLYSSRTCDKQISPCDYCFFFHCRASVSLLLGHVIITYFFTLHSQTWNTKPCIFRRFEVTPPYKPWASALTKIQPKIQRVSCVGVLCGVADDFSFFVCGVADKNATQNSTVNSTVVFECPLPALAVVCGVADVLKRHSSCAPDVCDI